MWTKLRQLLFGCRCTNYCFPRSRKAPKKGELKLYVVCLDCGREFLYDWGQMRKVSGPNQGSKLASVAQGQSQ